MLCREMSNNESKEKDKLTLSYVSGALRQYLDDDSLFESWFFYLKAVAGLLGSIFLLKPVFFVRTVFTFCRTVVGIALGIGLGGGLGLHIFSQLQKYQSYYDKERQKESKVEALSRRRKSLERLRQRKSLSTRSLNNSSGHHQLFSPGDGGVSAEDGDTYISLMAEAGYAHFGVLRGQVLRSDHEFWNILYRFTDERIHLQRGPQLLCDEWPALPEAVSRQLGRFIEHVMRDYVSGWYSIFDSGIHFRNEQEKRDAGIPRDGGDNSEQYNNNKRDKKTAVPTESPVHAKTNDQHRRRSNGNATPDKIDNNRPMPRKMVLTTLNHRKAPMIDCCYKMMSLAFGDLATRTEHVNLIELVMIKFTQVIGKSFQVYRALRKTAQDKKIHDKAHVSSRNIDETVPLPAPTEVEVTREFLLAGKLHRAVVFGLDIPSLLFADASGKECGVGIDDDFDIGNSSIDNTSDHPHSRDFVSDPIHVLESRLYHSNILKECELDYNRVLANRLIRTLMPKSETNSQCVLALLTEIIASSVLTPIMNLWNPSFLNGIIVQTLANAPEDSDGTTIETTETDNTSRSRKHYTELNVDERNDSNTKDSHFLQKSVEESKNNTSLQPSDDIIQRINESTNSSVNGESVDTLEPCTIGLTEQSSELEPSLIDDCKFKTANTILTLLSIALADLANFMNFEKCRIARQNHEETEVDWEDAECQHSVLKLVLVIEAALLDSRYHNPAYDLTSINNNSVSNITDIFMEMTSNMEIFEKRIDEFVAHDPTAVPQQNRTPNDFESAENEISTMRTLISAWLHTGQLFRAIKLICKASDNMLASYYPNGAFLSMTDKRERFLAQVKCLDGVDIMVDTMSVLETQKLVLSEEFELLPSENLMTRNDKRKTMNKPTVNDINLYYGRQSTPRYLDFHKNEAFAASLRAERNRRNRSWLTRKMNKDIQLVVRNTASKRESELHSELHNLARLFHNGTSIMTIRDAARKREQSEAASAPASDEKVSLLTVEIISSRRRIEVPDDDSSFLLRAQSRPLNPVSIHLDDRNHDMSYKCFLTTYEEPAAPHGSNRHYKGCYLRRCLLQYYPSDRTALILLQKDARKLDKRKRNGSANDSAYDQENDDSISSYFSHTFLRQRYLCQKVAATQSFLSSSLMEPSDFNAFPRTGKALDFVYKMSLFDRPVVDLAGRRFKVQDSASRGVLRADASSFEVTDASLTYVLLKIGKGYGAEILEEVGDGTSKGERGGEVETGPDGYPILFLRFSKFGDQSRTELKPYRLSFVRAALMVTSARQEAQLQSLVECVKAGSAKSATKERIEARLKLVKKILYFANNIADQHCLNQDLKIGHFLDRGQLQRNGLLNLRYPTSILQLQAKVEGQNMAKNVPNSSLSNTSHAQETVLYKIRCTVVVELVDPNGSSSDSESYTLDDGSYATVYREEFVVYRSMQEFQLLHKQLKSQVALTESTMSTGNRIVGAATAALSASSRTLNRRNKKILIPSLAQASKIGSMGITKRSILKRMELLDEYISYLLSSNSLMNRCSELLLFLGASHPFPPEVTVTKARTSVVDTFGRTDFIRSVALKNIESTKLKIKSSQQIVKKRHSAFDRRSSIENASQASIGERVEPVSMDPAILNKVDQVPLSEVRNRIVELVRLLFSFEDASFLRSQMLSALETASFVAVAKQSDFRRVLHDLHVRHLSGDVIGGWIETLLELLWPNGVWGTARPLLTKEEEAALREKSKLKLHRSFPDQFRKILGKELTVDGLDMIHEMMQNRIVLKSLVYMLFDLLWIEVFPELRDTLPCASAIDLDLF